VGLLKKGSCRDAEALSCPCISRRQDHSNIVRPFSTYTLTNPSLSRESPLAWPPDHLRPLCASTDHTGIHLVFLSFNRLEEETVQNLGVEQSAGLSGVRPGFGRSLHHKLEVMEVYLSAGAMLQPTRPLARLLRRFCGRAPLMSPR
jgi:hypothetical protein